MPDDPVLARYCGACNNHLPVEQRCAINMSYAAFVMLDTPANGCPEYQDRERCAGESQAQSVCRPAGILGLWQAAQGGKP